MGKLKLDGKVENYKKKTKKNKWTYNSSGTFCSKTSLRIFACRYLLWHAAMELAEKPKKGKYPCQTPPQTLILTCSHKQSGFPKTTKLTTRNAGTLLYAWVLHATPSDCHRPTRLAWFYTCFRHRVLTFSQWGSTQVSRVNDQLYTLNCTEPFWGRALVGSLLSKGQFLHAW